MKTVVSKELLARLQDAAANGSAIASGIMSELQHVAYLASEQNSNVRKEASPGPGNKV